MLISVSTKLPSSVIVLCAVIDTQQFVGNLRFGATKYTRGVCDVTATAYLPCDIGKSDHIAVLAGPPAIKFRRSQKSVEIKT